MIKAIQEANFVVIKADNKFLSSASALYTYILTLHKKVSLVCEDEIDRRLIFLPWTDKCRKIVPSSSDLIIELDLTSSKLYKLFIDNNIKINQKMATALYAGLLLESDGFLNSSVDGTIFAIARELIEYKAEYRLCTKMIMKSTSLSAIRLKAILLNNMILSQNATVASLHVSDEILKATGAGLKDCDEVMNEALKLPHVNEVRLVKIDESDKIIKNYKDVS